MAKDILHVVPHDQNWAVKREGNERVSSTHPTQKDAIDAARELAKEQDDIVIHRPDGTIRERVTYFGTEAQPNGTTNGERRAARAALQPRDWLPVASRVSWGAVLAGAVVAVATYITLSLFSLAIGLAATDQGQMRDRSFALTAAITSGVIMLASMFLGGFVASRATAGEQQHEAAVYGVLVWGAVFLLLVPVGLSLGFGLLGDLRQIGLAADSAVSAERMQRELGLTDQQTQRYTTMVRESQGVGVGTQPAQAAWWAFGAVALSLLAAIGGGLIGAGSELVLRRTGDERPAVVVPRPA